MRGRAVAFAVLVLLVVAGLAAADRPADAGSGQGGGNGNGSGGNGSANGNGNGNNGNGGDGSGNEAHGNGNAGAGNADGTPGNGNAANGNGAAAGNGGGSGHGEAGATPAPAPTPAPAASVTPSPAHGNAGGQGNAHGNGNGNGNAATPEAPAGAPAPSAAGEAPGRSGDAPGHAVAAPTPAAAADRPAHPFTPSSVPAAPVARPADDALEVRRGAAGNALSWDAPDPAAGQVQLWRRDATGWTALAQSPGDGGFLDTDGTATSEYRLTWTQEPVGRDGLAAISVALTSAPRMAGDSATGAWLLAALWGAIALVGTVRAVGAPRRVITARVADGHDLLALLGGVPGLDQAALEHVAARGLRTVGDLRRLDADAVAFWAQVPARSVRDWQTALELVQWPTLPPGAGQRLALAGQTSLRHLADVEPAELHAALQAGSEVPGPGLPATADEVASWVAEARQSLGLPPAALVRVVGAPTPTP